MKTCGNCGYWLLSKYELGRAALAKCHNTRGDHYLQETKSTFSCPLWGPEGGKGPGSQLEPCLSGGPRGQAKKL